MCPPGLLAKNNHQAKKHTHIYFLFSVILFSLSLILFFLSLSLLHLHSPLNASHSLVHIFCDPMSAYTTIDVYWTNLYLVPMFCRCSSSQKKKKNSFFSNAWLFVWVVEVDQGIAIGDGYEKKNDKAVLYLCHMPCHKSALASDGGTGSFFPKIVYIFCDQS